MLVNMISYLRLFFFNNTNIKKFEYQLDPLQYKNILSKTNSLTEPFKIINFKTGKFTGRSPQDRYFVLDGITKQHLNWKDNNQISIKDYTIIKKKLKKYIFSQEKVYRRDFYVRNNQDRENFSFFTDKLEYDLFVYNMFLRPLYNEIIFFKNKWNIYHSSSFEDETEILNNKNFVIINLNKKEILIGGTGYTGEIKKSVFSALNVIYPLNHNILPMHCAANVDLENKNTALFFGLSGTGKTSLSTDKDRLIIGDDEHGWTNKNTIFNYEGGCYAKVIDLSKEKEPEIWNALHSSAMLENVILTDQHEPNFSDSSITENMRVSYPLSNLNNVSNISYADPPQNIFLLTCDAFGIIPPLSLLDKNQAIYHYLSGYTSKIAGTEMGINEPIPTFSPCYGAPFMPLKLKIYADNFYDKINNKNIKIWLINTGWVKGNTFNGGKRIDIEYSRLLIKNVLENKINYLDLKTDIHFKFKYLSKCNGIPSNVLNPDEGWSYKNDYYEQKQKLISNFRSNFKKIGENLEKLGDGGPDY